MKKINLFTPIMLVLEGNYIHKTICKHLMNQGICSMKELCMHNKESLQGFKGIKNKSLATIKSVIAEYGLHLGMDESELLNMPKICRLSSSLKKRIIFPRLIGNSGATRLPRVYIQH